MLRKIRREAGGDLSMTDRELRIRAWELYMGAVYCPPPAGAIDTLADMPDFLNDMGAAWGLTQRLREPRGSRYATVSLVDRGGAFLCTVLFDFSEGDFYQVFDKSAERAITRAFIMAMEGEADISS